MKVKVIKNGPKYIPFSEVKVGETFRLKDPISQNLFMKFPLHDTYQINAITLLELDEENPCTNVWFFNDDVTVYLVKTELTVYED